MNLQLEAVLSRVERTLQIIWPESGGSVSYWHDPHQMANWIQCKMTFHGDTICWNTAIDGWSKYDNGFYEHLMEVIPRQFVAEVVGRACEMSRQRFQPRGMQHAHPYRGR